MATKLPLFYLTETGFRLAEHVRKGKEWVHFSFINALLKRNNFLALGLHDRG